MTVEEKSNKVTVVEDHEMLRKMVFEVTGISSVEKINEAVKACKNEQGEHNIDDVIAYLVQEKDPVPVARDRQVEIYKNKSQSQPSTLASSNPVIDLTAESNEDELQQAIAASLKDHPPGVSREDQEISRVIEVSLKDSKPGSKRKRTDANNDASDDAGELRVGNNPVGIKNVGLTCWFSSVVQTLFHLPVFRNLVLQYGFETKDKDSHALKFMQELRELFALMLCTKRRYVDPTDAVEIIKQSSGFGTSGGARTSANTQEDVNEFKHKLFDLLEEAFKADREQSSVAPHATGAQSTHSSTSADNPMVNLFRGRVTVERISLSGEVAISNEEFGQWILSVDGLKDIHESIEASVVSDVQVGPSDSSSHQKSVQEERWFAKLPPFLTFELVRANFNQQLHRAEKIHNKFTFPNGIFLDRYLECNKEIIRGKREKSKTLKEQLADLQIRLDRYLNFGSGSKRFPLREVLQCTLEFANGNVGLSPVERSPSPMHVSCTKGSSLGSPSHEGRNDYGPCNMDIPSPSATFSPAPMELPVAAASVSPVKLPSALPAPRHVTRDELQVLQECLTRWRTEVEADIKELHNNISTIENQLANIYEGEELKKHYYQLHSVVVHDGQASSGHYWAYVKSVAHENRWLKFNDMTVSESDWEELERDGAGGYRNSSAYSLIYVSADMLNNMHQELPSIEIAHRSLPEDLKRVVDSDWASASLSSDVVVVVSDALPESAMTHSKTQPRSADHLAGSSPIGLSSRVPVPETSSGAETAAPCIQHAACLATFAQPLLSGTGEDKAAKPLILDEVVQAIYVKLNSLAEQLRANFPRDDTRLVHIAIYLMVCTELSENDIKTNFIIDLMSQCECRANNRLSEVVELARWHRDLHRELYDKQRSQELHNLYDLFRRTVALFVQGAKLLHEDKPDKAIKWLLEACRANEHLLKLYDEHERSNSKRRFAALDSNILAYYRRICLLHLNDVATRLFENDYREAQRVETLVRLVITPALRDLANGSRMDTEAAEEIRKKWCDLLSNDNFSESQQENLRRMLEALLDVPPELRVSYECSSIEDLDNHLTGLSLQNEYKKVFAEAHQRYLSDTC